MSCDFHNSTAVRAASALLEADSVVDVLKSLLSAESTLAIQEASDVAFDDDQRRCIGALYKLAFGPEEEESPTTPPPSPPDASTDSSSITTTTSRRSSGSSPDGNLTREEGLGNANSRTDETGTESAQDASRDNGNGTASTGGVVKKDKPKPEPKRADPFVKLYNVTEYILPPSVAEHLKMYGYRSHQFIGELYTSETGTLGYDLRPDADADPPGKVLSVYTYSRRLEHRFVLDSIRWCYACVGLYLTIKHKFPNLSGKVLGPKTVQKFLAPLEVDWQARGLELPWDEVRKEMSKYCLIGMKISRLCDDVGDEFIFYMAHRLTEDWCKRRLSPGSQYYAPAVEKMKKLISETDQGENGRLKDLGRRIKERFHTRWLQGENGSSA